MNQDPAVAAFEQFRAGRNDESAKICLDILAHNPDNAEINQLLGVIRSHEGKFDDAVALLKRAASAPTATAEMHNNFGSVLFQSGHPRQAINAYKQALALDPDYAEALNNMGVAYRYTRQATAAIAAFKKAIELRPDMIQARTNLRAAYSDVVPAWHFAMMADDRRNAAYEAAIRRAVPGKRVLEIGTGAGLLAMMAGRAGAKTVTTCEAEELVADRAREIVARNGLADRVNVIGKPSFRLAVGDDLPERAEVLIQEILTNDLIVEGVLPALEHAYENLLTPDAVVVPAVGSVMGYLAGGETLKESLFVDNVAGFDLSPFNDFAPPILTTMRPEHDVLSDDKELLRFDFRQKSFPPQNRAEWLVATKPGLCIGVMQWIRIDLDSETRYENRPGPTDDKTHWFHLVHRFPRLIRVQPGDVVPIVVRHDRRRVNIDLAE